MMGRVFKSLLYSLSQISFGLIIHPYQTMQSLVKEKVFVWMTLLPSIILSLITLFWRFGFVPLVQIIFSCSKAGFIGCDFLPFFSNWITFFCIYWQILLFYLLLRFSIAFRE